METQQPPKLQYSVLEHFSSPALPGERQEPEVQSKWVSRLMGFVLENKCAPWLFSIPGTPDTKASPSQPQGHPACPATKAPQGDEETGTGAIASIFPMKVKVLVAQSCLTLCNPMDCSPSRSFCPRGFPGKNTDVGCLFSMWLLPNERFGDSFIARGPPFICIRKRNIS